MSNMDFLKEFQKSIDKLEGVSGSSKPPRYWYSSGNYVLNRIISGSFYKGIPQGRITGLMGPSSSGKSFMIGNVVKSAQDAGAYILAIDSENALDDNFMQAIGVNTENNYMYKDVMTIAHVNKIVSSFLKGYKGEYGDDPNAPQILIALDSLDMLLTDTEWENYKKGVLKGDQGQRNKQLKAMLRGFVQDIKNLNVAMVVTGQVYRNQDIMNGEGVWIVSDAVRYSMSQIILLTKLKLKDKVDKKIVSGIKMKCQGFKTRFTKPFQDVTIEVPYETGIDKYSGLADVAVGLNILKKKGSRLVIDGQDKSWYEKDIATYADDILVKAESMADQFLQADIEDFDEDRDSEKTSIRKKRARKAGLEVEEQPGDNNE